MSIAQVVAYSPEQVGPSAPRSLELSVSPKLNPRRPLRLRLSPSIGRGALDGAWWPYSRDLATEAVDLVDHFPASFDRICRVVYSTPDWEPSSRRVKAAKVFVSLGSFPRDDTHLVLLKNVASRVLQLLVVPPEWDDRAARQAMRIAALPSNVKSAATILTESDDQDRAAMLSHWDDDGGTDRPAYLSREPADLTVPGDATG
jgi:Family of unknown function (DUF5994)